MTTTTKNRTDRGARGHHTMTRTEAIAYIASCGEDDGPEDRDEAAEIFLALFGVEPDADDDHLMVWSHCCAWREDGVS